MSFRPKRDGYVRPIPENTTTTTNYPLTPSAPANTSSSPFSSSGPTNTSTSPPSSGPTNTSCDPPPSYSDVVAQSVGFNVPEKIESTDLPTYADYRNLPKTDNSASAPSYPIHPTPTAPNESLESAPHFPIAPATDALNALHSSNAESSIRPQASENQAVNLPYSVNPPK